MKTSRILLILVFLCTLMGMPPTWAQAGSPPVEPAVLPGVESSAGSNQADSGFAGQFAVGDHVVGFTQSGLALVSGGHVLRIDFVADGSPAEASDPVFSADETAQADPALDGAPGLQPLCSAAYHSLWQGVDLEYSQPPDGLLMSTFILAPGADANAIRLVYRAEAERQADGSLAWLLADGQMLESAPTAWQEIDGQIVPVSVEFVLSPAPGAGDLPATEVGFVLGSYDPAYPMVIDPTLTWNTFAGGGLTDRGSSVSLDASGNIYIVGSSKANWGAPVRAYSANGVDDVFVAKLDSAGNLKWNTFLGGAYSDYGRRIAVGSDGAVYVIGESEGSWGSPVRAYSGSHVTYDVFAAELNSSGVLQWNTFLGSSASDAYGGIGVDANGNVFVSGTSTAAWGTGPLVGYHGGYDAFAVKLNTNGGITWLTFIGGLTADMGEGLTVDWGGNVYVTGTSDYTWGLPVTSHKGNRDVFVVRMANQTGALAWNTFLGSPTQDYVMDISVDALGNSYITGYSDAAWGAPVRAYSSGNDQFVASVDFSGASRWNTFLGGAGSDIGESIAINSGGTLAAVGYASAAWGSPQRAHSGLDDAYAVLLNSASGVMSWNTFLGGTKADHALGVRVDSSGSAVVVGDTLTRWTDSVTTIASGVGDAMVTRLNPSGALVWNSYLGANGDDYINAIAISGNDTLCAVGHSNQDWIPLSARQFGGQFDAFVVCYNSASTVVMNTFLGGTGMDYGNAIAVDALGNIFVAGTSYATWGAPVRAFQGNTDVFVAKLTSGGDLTWNTFLGGISIVDVGLGLALDGFANAYVSGYSLGTWGSPVRRAYTGGADGFVAKVTSNGGLEWVSFQGGASDDISYRIAVRPFGEITVVGDSAQTWGIPLRAHSAGDDAFAARLDASGNLTWHTFLGGAGGDVGRAVVYDANGNVYIGGSSSMGWGAPQRDFFAGQDGYIAKLNTSGGLVWSIFLGGYLADSVDALSVSSAGNIYAGGASRARWGNRASTYTGGQDAFAAVVNANGKFLTNLFYGSSLDDAASAIAFNNYDSRLLLGGSGFSAWGSATDFDGGWEGFVAKIDVGAFPPNRIFLPAMRK